MAGKGVLWDVGAGWCGDGGSGMGRGLCDCPRKGLVNLEVPCVSLRYSDYAVRWSNFPERRNEGSNDDGGKFTARPTYK